jgi:hypothetical protein
LLKDRLRRPRAATRSVVLDQPLQPCTLQPPRDERLAPTPVGWRPEGRAAGLLFSPSGGGGSANAGGEANRIGGALRFSRSHRQAVEASSRREMEVYFFFEEASSPSASRARASNALMRCLKCSESATFSFKANFSLKNNCIWLLVGS